MKKKLAAILFSFSVLPWLTYPSMAADAGKTSSVRKIIQSTVTVESLDVPNRLLMVRDSTGATQIMEVPESIKNFPQLKAGDRITTRYQEALVAEIKKPGEASKIRETRESATAAPPGAKPGGAAQRQVRSLITVKSVDPEKNTLTFEGPRAGTRTVEVNSPQLQGMLKQLKPGDQVEVTYTEALAVDVQPAKQ